MSMMAAPERIIPTQSRDLSSRLRHELQQPVQAIRLLLSTYQSGMSAEDTHELIEIMKAATSDLEGSVDAMCRFHQLSVGEVPVCPVVFDLNELIRERTKLLSRSFGDTKIDMKLEDAPLNVTTDVNLFTEIIDAAIGNAIEFAIDGVEIRLAISADAGKMTLVNRYSGPYDGLEIDPFAAFSVMGAERTRRPSRLGVGLSNAKAAAALIGCDTHLQLCEGTAVFTMTIPLVFADRNRPLEISQTG